MRSTSIFGLPVDILVKCYGALTGIILICVVIEMGLQAADYGVWGTQRWRSVAYQYGGFWCALLNHWTPNYTTQPIAMFVSYAFLHGGLTHLAVNMITLASLGQLVIDRVGQLRFGLIYVFSLLGGAFGFALFSATSQPMVGASGALFGLAGALISWEYTERCETSGSLWPVFRAIGFLIILNVMMYWAMDGQLAWETHLGGFLAGWVAGWWAQRRKE